MSRPYSPSLSVVLLPSARHEELLGVVEDWTRCRLLKPALWLCPDDVESEVGPELSRVEGRPPRVSATIIGRNGRRRVDLFSELGRHQFDLLRLIAVRRITPEQTFEEDQDVALDVLKFFLERAQPYGRTDFVRVNMVFAPTQVTGGSAAHLLEAGWHANVIVSPEDRPSSASFDVFTRETEPGQFDGFVIGHVATAGALWPGVEVGPYDHDQPRVDWSEVQVQRVAVRGVISDGLVLGVAERVVEECASPVSPLMDAMLALDDPQFQGIPPQKVDATVEQMVALTLLLDDGRLSHHSAIAPVDGSKREISVGQGLKEFFAFAADKTASLPLYLWDFFSDLVTGRLTRTLHGKDGEAVVVAAHLRSSMDATFLQTMDVIERERVRLQFLADEPLPPIRADIYPRLWEGIRKLSFAILDGSPGPAGVQMPQAADGSSQTPVLMDAHVVYPDCQERWPVPTGISSDEQADRAPSEELGWLDVPRAQALLAGLEARRTRLQAREAEMLGRLDGIREHREAVQDRILELEFACMELRDARDWARDDLEAQQESTALDESSDAAPLAPDTEQESQADANSGVSHGH